MDEALKKLEEDYLDAVENNDSASVEEFIEAFLYDSWSYNERNLATIKTAMSRYSQQQIDVDTFSNSFKRMVDRVQEKLQELDGQSHYPVIQDGRGASLLIAFVDGLVIQYFAGTYTIEQLEKDTPYLMRAILQLLKAES